MSKSIQQILIDLDQGKYLDKGGTDQALEEIGAIVQEAYKKGYIDGGVAALTEAGDE